MADCAVLFLWKTTKDVYRIITKTDLTKLEELNKILWYRTKCNKKKDKEKEEYAS